MRVSTASLLGVFLASSVAGCLFRTGGICVDDPSDPRCVDGSTPQDAGLDASIDAGPCGRACIAPTPLCDESSGACVECLGPSDCDAPTPACVDSACEECSADSDCPSAAEPRCDEVTHACSPCTADADCSRLTATPVCDELRGACVECTADTEAARCGPNSCRRADGACTDTARGSQDTCDACEADSECATGRRCVEHVFMEASTGTYCFLEAEMGGCGDTDMSRRPFRTRTEATSIDGITATYCMPPTLTTCPGLRDTQSTACDADDDCGLIAIDDAYCPIAGSGAGVCSYRCTGGLDCTAGLSCGGTPQHCRP